MGAINSCCIPRRYPGECIENHASSMKHRSNHRNLSAAFNLSSLGDESEQTQNLLNINSATEEELMTLPGINRATSRSIIEYRCRIGGFKKVEDLALVSGVGAVKLSHIRQEICVNHKRSGSSRGSSPDSSRQDLTSSGRDIRRTNSSTQLKVNINTANVFQLMKVKGIGQTFAENIVTYRDRKGPFKGLDDLVKVKGIGPGVLSAIRHHLVLDDNRNSNATSSPNHIHSNGELPNMRPAETCLPSAKSIEELIEVLGPLAKKAIRPNVTPFTFRRNNTQAVRIASWNLDHCSLDKVSNPGVRDVVCMTILENGFGLVAFQELSDRTALTKICEELNNPTLPNVQKWKGSRGKWDCIVSEPTGRMFQGYEHNGFLFDVSQGVQLIGECLLTEPHDETKKIHQQPFIGFFRINSFDFVVISVHLKACRYKTRDSEKLLHETDSIPLLVQLVDEILADERNIIILGDFNLEPGEVDFGMLRDKGYTNCIVPEILTTTSSSSPAGSYDNIWLNAQTRRVSTGCSSVVREGLSNVLIPNGWFWGGVVSSHCPVWAEFYTDKDFDSQRLSTGFEGIKFTLSD